ncbi:MAG: substrate-binding domain-containing protein [Ferruginibacter sp.]
MAAHDIPFDPLLILQRGTHAEAVPLLITDILKISTRPDAVFAVNDMCAVLCMKALMKEGITIPADIAFAGINNDIVSTIIEPNLTTIHCSGTEIGEIVANAMIDRLNSIENTSLNYTSLLKGKLIIRNSSKKRKDEKKGHFRPLKYLFRSIAK